MSYFEDFIEHQIENEYQEYLKYYSQAEEKTTKLINITPKTLVLILKDIGVPENQYKSMVLDIMKKVEEGNAISQKQKNSLFGAVFF